MPHISELKVTTVCAFRGQLIAGGFCMRWLDTGLNTVAWSLIGHACFILDRSNESGYTNLVGSDEVLKLVPSRHGFLAYGDGSIGAFLPVNEPVVTFGKRMLTENFGIAGRDAVSGDGEQHFFVDNAGDLWRIDNEFKMQRLGFGTLFKPFLKSGEKVSLSYDSRLRQCHIAFNSAAFVLGSQGNLTENWKSSSKLNIFNGDLHGSSKKVSDPKLYLETDIIDFQYSGIKTITSLELIGSLPENPRAKVLWRNNKAEDFRETSEVRFSPNGICYVFISAVEFKFVILGENYQNVELQSLNIKYQASDKRNIRGDIENVG